MELPFKDFLIKDGEKYGYPYSSSALAIGVPFLRYNSQNFKAKVKIYFRREERYSNETKIYETYFLCAVGSNIVTNSYINKKHTEK